MPGCPDLPRLQISSRRRCFRSQSVLTRAHPLTRSSSFLRTSHTIDGHWTGRPFPRPPLLTTMFVLSTVQDTLFIPASSFNPTATSTQPPTSAQSLSLALNTKYANRVIPDVGLCVCLFDILEASEGKVKWGDGGLWHKLKARLVVFRPFVGEVLVGKVKSSDESGIKGEQAASRAKRCLHWND